MASGRNYSKLRKKEKIDPSVRGGEPWQQSAWDAYDLVPEFHQGCNIVGALLSRARLVVLERGDDGRYRPTENVVARAALDEFYGGEAGHAEMLRLFGIHATCAGEGWIFGPGGDPKQLRNPSKWTVAAATQVTRTAGRPWKLNGQEIPGKPLSIRVWIPHPVDPRKSDPDARSALPALSQVIQLDKRTSAQIDSRLNGGGLLLIPDETSFPSGPQRALNPGDPIPRDSVGPGDADGLADLIFEAASKSIEDQSSAEAQLPIIGTAPGEHIGNTKLINFWSELDKNGPALREEKLKSIARALRMPVEVLLGTEGSNHWNAWLADENNVKIFGEPLLKIFTTAISTEYLWLALDGMPGIDDPQRFMIGADTSQMRLRPNRSKEATEMYDRGELSAEAMRRENGFEEQDAPDDAERKRQLLWKVASGSTTPEIVAAALRAEGLDLDLVVTDHREPAEARPTPSLEEHPTREIPQIPKAASLGTIDIGLVFAAEQLIDRALQRAGNRMKQKYGIKQPPTSANRLYTAIAVPVGDLDDLLTDAWSALGEFDYGVPADRLERALDTYTRMLIGGQKTPTRESISRALQLLLSRNAA